MPDSAKPHGILYYIPLLDLGGAEKQLCELVLGLDRHRFAPVVWHSEPPGALEDVLRAAEVPILHLPLEGSASSIRDVAACLRTFQPILFHSFNYWGHCLDVFTAVESRIPLIITTRRNMRYWDPAQEQQPWERVRNRLTTLVIANSHSVASLAMRVERIPAEKMRVVHNGVAVPDRPTFPGRIRRELGLPAEAVLIGNVANLRSVKGHVTLIRACQRVFRRVPNTYLILCGADTGMGIKLRQLISEIGLERRVCFPGVRSDLSDVYNDIDIYAHPSVSEGSSNAILEAMAHARPVVATSVGGSSEVVLHNATGLLVQPEHPEELASAILALTMNKVWRRQLGEAGRQRAMRQFSLSAMIRKHEEIYLELLEWHQTQGPGVDDPPDREYPEEMAECRLAQSGAHVQGRVAIGR